MLKLVKDICLRVFYLVYNFSDFCVFYWVMIHCFWRIFTFIIIMRTDADERRDFKNY